MHRVFRKHDYWIFINHYLPEKKRCLTKRIFSMLWSPLLGRCINQLHLKNTTLRKQDASKMHFRYFNFHISCYYLLPSFYKYLYIDFDWISIRTFFPSERIRVEDEGSWSKVINCFSRSMTSRWNVNSVFNNEENKNERSDEYRARKFYLHFLEYERHGT